MNGAEVASRDPDMVTNTGKGVGEGDGLGDDDGRDKGDDGDVIGVVWWVSQAAARTAVAAQPARSGPRRRPALPVVRADW
jgi:hypothetical protein